jgi:8-oxo-dGTP pyrophosphatase MutT (NUDIX family)
MGWVITPRVLSCQSYASLPDRRIVFSPFPRRRIVSFGTIVYCLKSQRWLLVRTRHSYAFNTIMSGMFQKSDVPVIISYLTQNEFSILQQIYHGKTSWRSHSISMHSAETEMRFNERWELVKSHIQRPPTTPLALSTPWTFPKGRIENHEAPYKCALREFSEETGLSASLLGIPAFPEIIGESYVSYDHFVYETKCWLFCLPEEPALTQPNGIDEIAERKWCTQEEAQTLLSPSKYAMLLQAKSRIDSEILNPRSQNPPYLPNYGEHIPIQPEEPDRLAAEEPHGEG